MKKKKMILTKMKTMMIFMAIGTPTAMVLMKKIVVVLSVVAADHDDEEEDHHQEDDDVDVLCVDGYVDSDGFEPQIYCGVASGDGGR